MQRKNDTNEKVIRLGFGKEVKIERCAHAHIYPLTYTHLHTYTQIHIQVYPQKQSPTLKFSSVRTFKVQVPHRFRSKSIRMYFKTTCETLKNWDNIFSLLDQKMY